MSYHKTYTGRGSTVSERSSQRNQREIIKRTTAKRQVAQRIQRQETLKTMKKISDWTQKYPPIKTVFNTQEDVLKGEGKYILKTFDSVLKKAGVNYKRLEEVANSKRFESKVLPQKTADYIGEKVFKEKVKYLGGRVLGAAGKGAIKAYSTIKTLKKVLGK